MNTADRVRLVMRLPPPLLFVITFFVGVGMQRLVPLNVGSIVHSAGVRGVGVGLVVAGLLLMLSSVGIFLTNRTTLIPFGTAAQLISRGPFRFTRNPMYLSLVLVYAGAAGILSELWPLLLLPLPVIVIHRIVIPFEETRMRQAFGDAYQQYCAKVRRWI